ncbi:AAA family ATPase [Sorangium sp. So ce1024]|uniref:AAA family ATPase n=1 Tax=Sorangium sp. So ce1024 TaxID=3133327 RepID=UPI003F12528C
MATHLSARLVWHDNGWDGRVCQNPKANTCCIVHQHVRENRQDEEEQRSKGVPLQELKTKLPPCSRDAGAFAPRSYRAVHSDPLEFRRLLPVEEDVPQYSCCPSPYRWMREENFRDVCEAENLRIRQPDTEKDGGWVMEPDRQKALLTAFWGKLEPGRSLIFYYCKDGHPFESAASRVLVGVGRISEVGPQLYFGTTPTQPEPYPVWSRRITQDFPRQGVRLPYQEYLRESLPVDGIVCSIPNVALPDFSFVGEHVTDDSALTVIEHLIHSVQRVRDDAKIAGDWEGRLAWLNDVLAELWQERGPFPGVGSVLQFLGCQTGTTFQRTVLAPMARKDESPWDYVRAMLDGRIPIEPAAHAVGLKKAQDKWKKMPRRQALLSTLVRFELTPAQVQRIADPTARAEAGIAATEAQLVENPYLICELDQGTDDSEVIGLETIDHGMLPDGDAALFIEERVEPDDPRRVRAIAGAVLKEASGAGDTLLTLDDAFARVRDRFHDRRQCRPDVEVFRSDQAFHGERLWLALENAPSLVALRELQELEAVAADLVRQRAGRVTGKGSKPDWATALKWHFKEPKTERESAAFKEKLGALETLFTQKLSILTGGAGTGKTSVLQVFLAELERVEGKHPLLLLAPTGKARVRLAAKTGRNAMTIHQFLLKQDWILPATFALKHAGGRQFAATTVVIDECSMIPTDLLGTLVKALDPGPLKRLVLVGDPNQLPPIGPGRPFVDIIGWVRKEHPDCLAKLSTCMRVDDSTASGTPASAALSLAEGYRSDEVHPADDEILSAIGRSEAVGDLECHFWKDPADLMSKLRGRLSSLLKIATNDYESFNRSLGIAGKASNYTQSEAWQILCPTRTDLHGTEELNRVIQAEYRGGILTMSRTRSRQFPRPFGDREIVWCDKVIQTRNRPGKAWPQSNSALNYIANGEIGMVSTAKRGQSGDHITVVFSTQPDVSYRYWRNQVNEDLELAYALTVHKAQGSDFDVVFLIVPQGASTLSRELIYTGLTRFRKRLVLLVEKDLGPLLSLRHPAASDTDQRNTHMFMLALRPDGVGTFHAEGLIHRTRRGVPVRSKSEVIVADTLERLGISYEYEKPLAPPDEPRNFRLPDFTVSYQGDIYYWEHLGMLGVPAYREAWQKKLEWYTACGFFDQLITSEDGPDGGIDAAAIERLARERVLGA